MQATGADGVMSAEGNLHNPALFANVHPAAFEITREYLKLCQQYPTNLVGILSLFYLFNKKKLFFYRAQGYTRGHVFKLLQHTLAQHTELREVLNRASTIDAMLSAVDIVEYAVSKKKGQIMDEGIPYWRCQPYVRPLPTPETQEIWHSKDARATVAAGGVPVELDVIRKRTCDEAASSPSPPPAAAATAAASARAATEPIPEPTAVIDEDLKRLMDAHYLEFQPQQSKKKLKKAKLAAAIAAAGTVAGGLGGDGAEDTQDDGDSVMG